jgi:hypothetical protein
MPESHEGSDVERNWFRLEVGPREIVVIDSATYVHRYVDAEGAAPRARIYVTGSYAGVYCAKLVNAVAPASWIGLDCGIGKDGAAVAGLWYFEALRMPAAASAVDNVELGNGRDLWENGVISRVNDFAQSLGVHPGLSVEEAARIFATAPTDLVDPDGENREIVQRGPNGHNVVATNSIAEALPEDRDTNVLCTGGHTGRSVIDYILNFRPYAFICSDGGIGKNNSGLVALKPANDAGIPGASVSSISARMGDGHSIYYDGVISAMNDLAASVGVRVGMSAIDAAKLLVERESR